ncbi:putative phage baseplate assembly protein [Agromyces terreus]|uniref:Phage baseplate assembly protein n=1 Tax=Agromyces terreus TaxID=424795 RepID=A0A9X2KB48_9MICO|nr:putative baseplate assembly protein [Agromyces terreus]MCP2369971.1 putative phage baseplate assembly protein [Agromyces terreus]
MNLPAPNLDDRRFQDLVDDAKRLVALRCPEWSDHNVSDPGVTLIEAFAFMTDELLYRLNRVPDRLYLAYLDLLGVTLFPPTNASADLVFWLSAPRDETVVVPARTEAGTPRTETAESIVFATVDDLEIPPRELVRVGSQPADGDPWVRDTNLRGEEIDAFQKSPVPGDALLFGLDEPAGNLAISLRIDCAVRGVGVDPKDPPIVWEAWCGKEWVACDVVSDGTGGLNRRGDVVLIVPAGHAASVVSGERAGWVRTRLVEREAEVPTYSASPLVRSVEAKTVGAVTRAIHATTIDDEVLGLSEGVPGQEFTLGVHPVVDDGAPFTVDVGTGAEWESWTEVDDFADQDADARVIRVDRTRGVVTFAPAVREADGVLRFYGSVPPKGAPIRVPRYRVGGGARGNVAPGALSVLRSTVPFVNRVVNRRAAHDGVDGESVEEAKARGPLTLRTLDRAVTLEDYEQLARRVAPSVARVRAVPATGKGEEQGVRLLVVPSAVHAADGRVEFADLIPSEDVLTLLADELERRRTVGARLAIEPPLYQGITIVAKLIAKPRFAVERLREDAVAALYRSFDAAHGGSDGTGWPFGRPVLAGEVYAVLQSLPGTELVDEVLLFGADPVSGKRGDPVQRIDLEPDALVFGFEHRVRVTAGV